MSAVLALAALAAAPASADAPPPAAIWVNPAGSVRVRTGPCGDRLCGWVVAASAQAIADARAGGTAALIGIELLRAYTRTGPTRWQGEVFVPDWNRTFFSRLEQLGPNHLRISGCIFGGLLCKSQTWTRA